MNISEYILIIPSFLVSAIHIFGLSHKIRIRGKEDTFHSFAAGVSVGYVFLIFLPEILSTRSDVSIDINLMLLGFVIFHVPLTYIFKHSRNKDFQDISNLIHGISISLYGFLISYSIVDALRTNIPTGVLLFVTLIMHNLLSEVTDYGEKVNDLSNVIRKILIISAPIIGGFFAISSGTNSNLNQPLLSLTAGAILYIVIREEIPKKEKSKPIYFLMGIVFLSLVMMGIH